MLSPPEESGRYGVSHARAEGVGAMMIDEAQATMGRSRSK